MQEIKEVEKNKKVDRKVDLRKDLEPSNPGSEGCVEGDP